MMNPNVKGIVIGLVIISFFVCTVSLDTPNQTDVVSTTNIETREQAFTNICVLVSITETKQPYINTMCGQFSSIYGPFTESEMQMLVELRKPRS